MLQSSFFVDKRVWICQEYLNEGSSRTLKVTDSTFKLVHICNSKDYNKTIRGDDMSTGEKLALLRKKKGITQEELSEILEVSRQSVSRWEQDAAFPETDKLIKLSRLFECSIDYLLSDSSAKEENSAVCASADGCRSFIRGCGYFFLATSADNQPKLRPFGMIHSSGGSLFIATDRRKQVYRELSQNPRIEIGAYNLHTRRWIRITGRAEPEHSIPIKEEMVSMYPSLKQRYPDEEEMFLAVFKLTMDQVGIF